jgi:hemerythrin superfamily protein
MEKYRFALCIENRDCEDLEKRKIYRVLPDHDAEEEGYLRVIDESGEDYLYPQSYFIFIQLPREAQEALRVAE